MSNAMNKFYSSMSACKVMQAFMIIAPLILFINTCMCPKRFQLDDKVDHKIYGEF